MITETRTHTGANPPVSGNPDGHCAASAVWLGWAIKGPARPFIDLLHNSSGVIRRGERIEPFK
ncbi:hypothetical protein D3C76_1433650 [compost metagenome]